MNREAEELLCAFARMSRMHLSVCDSEFHSVFSVSSSSQIRFCRALHRSEQALERCIASDLSARRACLESGKLYMYRCPFGLFEVIVPLYVCGELNGFLIAGKSLPQGEESTPLEAAMPYLSGENHYDTLCREIQYLEKHTKAEHEDLCRVLEALAERLSALGGVPNPSENIPAGVRKYLHRNFQQPITLSDLAMNFHCSTVSLTKWYYREYGKTIMEELNEIRMEEAKKLLRSTNASVGSVAASCGFSDAGYFTKCFRRTVGCTPTEWRTQ
ncbi:MAG: PocR ligand-binding domain-containing protein [Clostridia bacterium]|nr:PocR ligand-binding domain-containing protein [Clostridia bacterium]